MLQDKKRIYQSIKPKPKLYKILVKIGKKWRRNNRY
jgi:hypothetical protein